MTKASPIWVQQLADIAVGTVLCSLVTILLGSASEEMLWGDADRTVSRVADVPGPRFYVATTGNDSNAGTSSSAPWRTIQKAMNSATPGSTVNIMAGTYQERLTLNVSGASGAYITFQPYNFSVPAGGCGGYTGVTCGGDQVVLDYGYLGTNTSPTPLFLIRGKSYIRVQGLTFQNFTCTGAMQQGLRIEGASSFVEFNYNKFVNLRNVHPVKDGTAALLAIYVWGPANNVTFHGNEMGTVWTNMSQVVTFENGASEIVEEDDYIHDVDQIGIDVHGGSNNYIIRGNRLEYISTQRDGTVWFNNPSIAIYNDGANTGIIEGNLIRYAGVGVEALSEPGQPYTHNVTVRNNVVRDCQRGIVLGTWYSRTDGSSVSRINVWNNTFYGNAIGVVVRPMLSATVTWENNLFAGNATTYSNPLRWNPGTVGYNLYFGGGGGGPGNNNVTADPLFVNPSAGDLSLQPSSPAIGAGDPNSPTIVIGATDFAGSPRIAGGRVDIGAYAFQ